MNIISFDFENHNVRAHTDDYGYTWFNADDVCKALGFDDLAADILETYVRDEDTVDGFINVTGLYNLILVAKMSEGAEA
jgi:prophage antirepressor-like protein